MRVIRRRSANICTTQPHVWSTRTRRACGPACLGAASADAVAAACCFCQTYARDSTNVAPRFGKIRTAIISERRTLRFGFKSDPLRAQKMQTSTPSKAAQRWVFKLELRSATSASLKSSPQAMHSNRYQGDLSLILFTVQRFIKRKNARLLCYDATRSLWGLSRW